MSPVPSRCRHGGRGPELCQLLGQGGDFAKSPARVGSSSRYQKAAHKHPASCSPGVPGKDRKGHLDARCGLGPSTRGCCSEGAFGKYQRATSRLPAFSDLHLREMFIFASISGQKAPRGRGRPEQPHPMLGCPCWGRRGPQDSRHQRLGPLTGKQGLPRQQAGVGSSSAPMPGAPQPPAPREGMEWGGSEGLALFGARCQCPALGDAPERGRAPGFPEEETP